MNESYHIEQLRVRFFNFVNFVYFIIDEKTRETAIIDPSWNPFKVQSILKKLDCSLTSILLTHSHFDHINLVNWLIKKYNPQVYMALDEINFYNFRCKNLNPIEGDSAIKLGETEILSIFTPGHTIGSVCYLLPGHLFTGDTIFIEGCGLCDPNGGDPSRLFKSIRKIKESVQPDVRIFPGHSYGKCPGYTLNNLKKENIYLQIDDEMLFVNFRMRKNQKGFFNFK